MGSTIASARADAFDLRSNTAAAAAAEATQMDNDRKLAEELQNIEYEQGENRTVNQSSAKSNDKNSMASMFGSASFLGWSTEEKRIAELPSRSQSSTATSQANSSWWDYF